MKLHRFAAAPPLSREPQKNAAPAPQGGPLSPLLANLLLNELDRELERRGHRFARNADDCNIYVCSRQAGERVLESITRFLSQSLSYGSTRQKAGLEDPGNARF
jgi:RNA-directed DNA polymerase